MLPVTPRSGLLRVSVVNSVVLTPDADTSSSTFLGSRLRLRTADRLDGFLKSGLLDFFVRVFDA